MVMIVFRQRQGCLQKKKKCTYERSSNLFYIKTIGGSVGRHDLHPNFVTKRMAGFGIKMMKCRLTKNN